MDDGDGRHVQGRDFHAVNLEASLFPDPRGGGSLAFGKRIKFVIMDHHRNIGIAAQHMEEMVAAFAVTVAFSGDNDGCEKRIGHMDAQGRRKGSSMQSIEKITVEIVRQFGGLTYSGNEATLMGLFSQCRQRRLEGVQNSEIRASGTPLDRNIVLVVVDFHHRSAS
jgi:hypothetical protein